MVNAAHTVILTGSALESAKRDKEVIEKLIAHYTSCLDYIKTKIHNWPLSALLEYTWEEFIDDGICACASALFGQSIERKDWVLQLVTEDGGKYWTVPVGYAQNKDKLLLFLTIRLNILQSILKQI